MSSVFTDIIRRELVYAEPAELAERLGVELSQVYRWRDGKQPIFDNAQKVIEKLGGDLRRASPGYEPPMVKENPSGYKPSARLLGQVQAGAFTPAGDSTDTLPIDLSSWCKGVEKLGLIEVVGDSMAPRYMPGQYLVCKRVDDHSDIPDGTPCIFLERDCTTFKLLRRLDNGVLVAQPINHDHKLIALNGRKVKVQMIVVGSIDLPR